MSGYVYKASCGRRAIARLEARLHQHRPPNTVARLRAGVPHTDKQCCMQLVLRWAMCVRPAPAPTCATSPAAPEMASITVLFSWGLHSKPCMHTEPLSTLSPPHTPAHAPHACITHRHGAHLNCSSWSLWCPTADTAAATAATFTAVFGDTRGKRRCIKQAPQGAPTVSII